MSVRNHNYKYIHQADYILRTIATFISYLKTEDSNT
jgi:hypothetical protein